jgi:hypothetical protein
MKKCFREEWTNVSSSLNFYSMIDSGYSRKVVKSFLRFRGSRPGLFYDLSARETCPLRCSPAPSEREPGLPPQISREKTAPFHQSLRKDFATFLQFNCIVTVHPQILVSSQDFVAYRFIRLENSPLKIEEMCKEPWKG